jgi:CheY-like chemotaxis protein
MTRDGYVVQSLLLALDQLDGHAVVLQVGQRPQVETAGGRIELGSRALPAAVIQQILEQLLSAEALLALRARGRMQFTCAPSPVAGPEIFTVIASEHPSGGVLIRRGPIEGGGAPAAKRTAQVPPHVLMIDDSLDQLDLYEWALRGRYRISGASNGLAGVNLAARCHPDLVIVDLNMPVMDGWEVCWHLKRNPVTAPIPIIIMTANDEEDVRRKAADAGAADLLHKPCDVDQLQARVAGVILQHAH